MDDPSERRRGGRPPSAKRGTFSFRVTAELREKLEAEAGATSRPVSEVIEARLERSFAHDEMREIIREELRAALARNEPG